MGSVCVVALYGCGILWLIRVNNDYNHEHNAFESDNVFEHSITSCCRAVIRAFVIPTPHICGNLHFTHTFVAHFCCPIAAFAFTLLHIGSLYVCAFAARSPRVLTFCARYAHADYSHSFVVYTFARILHRTHFAVVRCCNVAFTFYAFWRCGLGSVHPTHILLLFVVHTFTLSCLLSLCALLIALCSISYTLVHLRCNVAPRSSTHFGWSLYVAGPVPLHIARC